jgi:hypothetical protein
MRMSGLVRAAIVCLGLSLPVTQAAAQSVPPADFGSLTVRVRPSSAEVLIDGERWVSPENSAALIVQLPPGRHTVELRAQGYRGFSTTVDIRRGETTPVNVSLPATTRAVDVPTRNPPVVIQGSTENGFVIAPDFRVAQLHHGTAAFAGLYGGYVFERRLLIGAGGYWQANPSHGERLAYGGAVVEWSGWTDRRIGFTAHGLAGYGQAQGSRTILFDPRMPDADRHGRPFGLNEGFFVAEPEMQVVARFGSRVSLHAGVGYRLTSSHDDLNGASGSLSLQFGR